MAYSNPMDNPKKQVQTFPRTTISFDTWLGQRRYDEAAMGEKESHYCGECGDWWGCQGTPCATAKVAVCGICVRLFWGING
jgi:hypothetical protein